MGLQKMLATGRVCDLWSETPKCSYLSKKVVMKSRGWSMHSKSNQPVTHIVMILRRRQHGLQTPAGGETLAVGHMMPYVSLLMLQSMHKYLHSIQTIEHRLTLSEGHSKHHSRLFARGELLGQFYYPMSLSRYHNVDFFGDFEGYFKRNMDNKTQNQYYFEGRIYNMIVANGMSGQEEHSELEALINDNMFVGYFRGCIREGGSTNLDHTTLDIMRDLQLSSIMEETSNMSIILPCFPRFILKKVLGVDLEKAFAQVSGTMVIDIQITPQLHQIFMHRLNRKAQLFLELSREGTEALPIRPTDEVEDASVMCKFVEKKCSLRYTIRKTFTAEVDNSYGQFFAPFGLTYINVIMQLKELTLRYPLQLREQHQFVGGVNGSTQRTDSTLRVNFINMDLKDYTGQSPITPFNQLLEDRNVQWIRNRLTKIDYYSGVDHGEYSVATNYLSLYSYYTGYFQNSNTKNGLSAWTLACGEREQIFRLPELASIQQSYKNLKDCYEKDIKVSTVKMFKLTRWNYIHIQVPIYKYWALYLIQIFIPIFILDVLNLFIFVQDDRQNNQDGVTVPTTISARIVNVTSLLLAYVVLIPVIRFNTPKTNLISFIFIMVYLSILPLFLSLIGIAKVEHGESAYQHYIIDSPPLFQRPFFLSAFIIECIVIFLVLFVLIRYAIIGYRNYSVQKHIKIKDFVDGSEVVWPWGYRDYQIRLNQCRGDQFIHRYADEHGLSLTNIG